MSEERKIIADDGLIARKQGRWAQQKLDFIDRYLPPALSATRRKDHRVFLDLFAGPGLNRTEDGFEFPGSPLRVLQSGTGQGSPVALSRYVGINLDDDDHEALHERVRRLESAGLCRVPDVSLINDDANVCVGRVLAGIPTDAWVCAFVDIEKPKQLPWATLETLRRRHWSVDLYLLFPLEMGWNRMIPEWQQSEHIFDLAFGCGDWRPIVGERLNSSHQFRARRQLLSLYESRLRTLWKYVRMVKAVNLRGDQKLYRMFHASNHRAGKNIAEWASTPAGTNLELFD